MSKKKEKKLIVDLRGAILILRRKTGRKPTVTEIASNYGLSVTTIANYENEAPRDVKFIHSLFVQNPNLKISDAVVNEQQKAVVFIVGFLRDNPELEFSDLVIEV